MNKVINFELSTSSIRKLQEEIENLVTALGTTINERFISLSFDWIIERAYSLLSSSGYNGDIVADVAQAFVKTIHGNSGRLTLDHPKGAYLELGVGIRGAESPHPEANAVGWEYDVDTIYKTSSRTWRFRLDDGELLDLRNGDILTTRTNSQTGKITYITRGGEGSAFFYNAIRDYVHNSSVIRRLFDLAVLEVDNGRNSI